MSADTITSEHKAASPISAAWFRHLVVLGVSLLALGALFYQDIESAVIVWWIYPAYSHCFLIIPISAWLIWERRALLLSTTPRSQPIILLAAIPFILSWLIGHFATITEARQFSLVAIAEVFIAATLGWRVYRTILFACLYLFFLVPTGQYLIPPLQEVTAKLVEFGLTLFSIPNFRDGLVFQLVNGRYEIAEACAGLRFLIATVALGTLFAHLVFRKPVKIAVFLAACFIFPIFGNGLRALATVIVANYTNNEVAAGFDHLVYGWVFAVTIIFILLFVGSMFRDTDGLSAATPTPTRAPPSGGRGPLAATFVAILFLSATAPAIAYVADSRPGIANQAALNDLLQISGWHKAARSGNWHIEFNRPTLRSSNSLVRDADSSAPPVDIDVNFYIRDRRAPSLLASANHAWQHDFWHPIEKRTIRKSLYDTDVPLDETVVAAGDFKRLVWTTYWIDGRFTTSSTMIRILEFRAGIAKGHSAVISVSTPINSTYDEARERLFAALSSIDDLSAGLEKVGTSQDGK